MRILALILVYWPKVACGALGERGRMAPFDLAAQGAALGRLLACFRTALVVTSLLGLVSACAPIEPWVKPYEREHLADAIMALDRNPVSSTYLNHVFESREGARGATGGVGGGCGCN
jgi:hypothetical protein